MKRIIVVATVIFSLVAAVLLALPYVVSSQSIKTQLAERIKNITSSQMTYAGEPTLTLNPYLGVELKDVVLVGEKQSEDQPDLLRIEKLKFSLKILPLLFGKTRFSDFKLIRPSINLLLHEDGSTNWTGIGKLLGEMKNKQGDAPVEAAKLASTIGNIKLGQFEIIDGIVESNISGISSTFRVTNLHAMVDWPQLSSSWKIKGQGVWRGEAVNFSNRVDKPLALLTSKKSGLKFAFKSPALIASFDGQATMISDIQLHGEASIATPSLPRLYELLVEDNSIGKPPFGNLLIEGAVSANAHEIRFDDAQIELDSNVATGNILLHLSDKKKPKISGTLAFTSLDVTPLIEIVSSKTPQKKELDKAVLRQNLFDFDFRFSAENYKFREHSFGALAATAMLTNNEWVFDIGEAEFFGGMIIATIASKTEGDAKEIELKGILRDVSMGDIARDWYGGEIVATGNADVNFALRAPGKTTLGNFREFLGSMKVTLTDGQLEGVDLVKAIPALIKNNGFVTVDEIKGVTPFNNLSLDILIYNGVGWITKGNAKGGRNEFRLSGKADLLRGSLAIYADIIQNASGRTPPRQARIFIGGTVKNPLVTRSPLAKNRLDEKASQGG